MDITRPGDASGVWLAGTVLTLLEQRFGPGRIPSVRALTRQIRDANDGASISHGQVHNVLNGSAANITDRTRAMLARFLGVSAARLVPPAGAPAPGPPATGLAAGGGPVPSTAVLAMRLSSLRPEELAAIEKAIDMVRSGGDTGSPPDGRDQVAPDSNT
jgi:hypothetical protein